MKRRADHEPVTSPDDPRLRSVGMEGVAGGDQIDGMLALPPRERLRRLLDTLDFEARAHRARILPRER